MQIAAQLEAFEGRNAWMSVEASGKPLCEKAITVMDPPGVFELDLILWLKTRMRLWIPWALASDKITHDMSVIYKDAYTELKKLRKLIVDDYNDLKARADALKKETTASMCRVCTPDIKLLNNLLEHEKSYVMLSNMLIKAMNKYQQPGYGKRKLYTVSNRERGVTNVEYCTATADSGAYARMLSGLHSA